MRKMIAWLVPLLLLVACQKPYETQIALGVNNERIDLLSYEAGHCYITVFSNSTWTISLSDTSWARLEYSEGKGIGYVRLEYDDNFSGDKRSLTITVSGSGKTCEILVTQPGLE